MGKNAYKGLIYVLVKLIIRGLSHDMKMDIVNPAIERYLLELESPKDEVLKEMERLAAPRNFPIIGPLVGRLIYQIALLVKAKRIFEMGSGFGYSAYWFALALGQDGEITCTDGSNENARLAKEFFQKGGIQTRVRFEVGDAIEIIGRTEGEFDIIFNDIDKELYPMAFRKALPKLRKGGLLIADNVLWGGAVTTSDTSPRTQGIRDYTKLLYESNGLLTTIIPLRDGVSITLKLS